MRLGIPRGFFYYDYMLFIKNLFYETGVEIIMGEENNDGIMERGSRIAVDEACLPIKLFIGQVDRLCEHTDKVFIPRIMKDCKGRWLCPKLLGIPELSLGISKSQKLLITEPLYFNDEGKTGRCLRKALRNIGIKGKMFEKNFSKAYATQRSLSEGSSNVYVESAWEFSPPIPRPQEIVLPNTKKIFLAGHCYNVYDKFSNGNIMGKLDEIGIEAITDKAVNRKECEIALADVNLIKKPFWESFVRTFGSAMHLRDEVDGIIYLSSFSCGPDAFTTEMIKHYIGDLPVMILKLDEHRGEAGFETRLEAFNDLIERRKAS